MIFPYHELLSKYGIKPKGIIHIGAHHAEEGNEYFKFGTNRILWIEGNPELIPLIKKNIEAWEGNILINALLADVEENEVQFRVTNSTMSSSILNLGTHKNQYPEIKVEKELLINTQRFDKLVERQNINMDDYDFVNIDIQGAELLALKGFGNYLHKINYIYTEINIDYLYRGCPLLDDIDSFLLMNGFKRVELSLMYKSWGDAFYIRSQLTKDEVAKQINESKMIIRKFRREKWIKKILNVFTRMRRKF